jgi:hypothetical protein
MLISKKQNGGKGNMKSEMVRHYESIKQKGDMLVEAWSKTPVGVKLDKLYSKNPDKARRVAFALRNENAELMRLKEEGTQIKSVFNTRPENVLRIIRIGVAQSNRAEIGHEWQLVTPDDAFYFVDTKYGSTKRGATLGGLIYEDATNTNYASEYNKTAEQTANGSTDAFTFNFSPVPIVPLSVRLIVGGKQVANDDGNGSWVGSAVTAGSITYSGVSAGTITVTLATAPANGTKVFVEAQWDSEVADNYDEWGTVELNLRRDRFNARPMPLTYQYSKMFELVLGTTGVGDAEEMLIKRVGDTHAMRKDAKFFEISRRQAVTNPITSFDADFVSAGSDNLYNHAQTLLQTLEKINGNLYDDIKRGELNKFVVGTQALAFIKMHKLWENDSTQPRVGGSYKAGTLDGKDVYVAPKSDGSLGNNEILMTYRNPDEDGDVNIAIGVLTELSAALDYPNLYRQGTLATVEDYKVINSKFFRLLQIQNL